MKKILVTSMAIVATILLFHSLGFAAVSQFTGTWKNADPNTRNLTKLIITGEGSSLKLHAWGKCHPTDCDWGEVRAYPYAPSVSTNMEQNARAVSAIFDTGFSQTILIVRPNGNNALRVEIYTRFTDRSNRSNYTSTETLNRDHQVRDNPIPSPIHPKFVPERRPLLRVPSSTPNVPQQKPVNIR